MQSIQPAPNQTSVRKEETMSIIELAIMQIPSIAFAGLIMFPAKYLHSRVLGCLAGMLLGAIFICASMWNGGGGLHRSVALFFYLAIAGFLWGQRGMNK